MLAKARAMAVAVMVDRVFGRAVPVDVVCVGMGGAHGCE